MSPFSSSSRTFLRFRSVSTWQKKQPYIILFVCFFFCCRLVAFPKSWSVPDVADFYWSHCFLSTGHKTFWAKWAHSSMKSQRATQETNNFIILHLKLTHKQGESSTWCSRFFFSSPSTHATSALKDLRHCNGTNWFWMELLSMAALVCYWDIFLTESWVERSLHMFLIDCWVVVFLGCVSAWVSEWHESTTVRINLPPSPSLSVFSSRLA